MNHAPHVPTPAERALRVACEKQRRAAELTWADPPAKIAERKWELEHADAWRDRRLRALRGTRGRHVAA